MNSVAGATTLGELATALAARAEEASIVADLKAGSEDAYAWLVEQYHQQIYNLVYRIVNDPTDAADATQEVFLKVFRGMNRFNGSSSLKTWMYRIAVHEAANQRRWWFRHKAKETSIEPACPEGTETAKLALKDTLEDGSISPFEALQRRELRTRVESELRHVPEPFRTTVVLRDLEELSYEEIAEVMETTLGTVKSRLLRGRDALKQRLRPYLRVQQGSRIRPRAGAVDLGGSATLATAAEIEVTS
jgi:RNA polymerase sigma-70 factor, ECF subfamily